MNAPHLHLILNHVPTIGSAIALGLLLLGLLRRQEALTRVSLEVFFVIALITLPAYLSGVATGMQLETDAGCLGRRHPEASRWRAGRLRVDAAHRAHIVARPVAMAPRRTSVRPQHRHRARPLAADADDDGGDSDDGRRDSPPGDDAGRFGSDRRAELDPRRVRPVAGDRSHLDVAVARSAALRRSVAALRRGPAGEPAHAGDDEGGALLGAYIACCRGRCSASASTS